MEPVSSLQFPARWSAQYFFLHDPFMMLR